MLQKNNNDITEKRSNGGDRGEVYGLVVWGGVGKVEAPPPEPLLFRQEMFISVC